MKVVILLLVLVGLIQAEVVTKSLVISEGENIYTQTITLNYDRNIQIIEVPQHNNIVHSRTIFDFKQGKLVESHPDSKTCYMRDIPKETAPMKKFAAYIEKNPVIKAASKEKTVQKAFTARRKMSLKSLSFMAMEIVAECRGSDFYEVTEVSMDVQKVSINVAPSEVYRQMMTARSNDCHMPSNCLWQTCTYGSDSCYWTVSCPQGDQNCNGMIHNSNFHNNGNLISCKACYNMMCDGCPASWEGCGPVLAPQNVKQCPTDPDYGKNCGEKFCEYHPNVAGGDFECSADDPETGYIQVGHTCILFCEPGHGYGGNIVCKEDGTWDESSLLDCP